MLKFFFAPKDQIHKIYVLLKFPKIGEAILDSIVYFLPLLNTHTFNVLLSIFDKEYEWVFNICISL